MGALADREFGTLSEGERKRTQIARALMTDPELMLLDEPAAGLDLGGREDLLGRLTELAEDPDAPAMVLVTHHVEEIPPGFTHALLLREGTVVAPGLLGETMTARQPVQDVRPAAGRRTAPATGTPPGPPEAPEVVHSPGSSWWAAPTWTWSASPPGCRCRARRCSATTS